MPSAEFGLVPVFDPEWGEHFETALSDYMDRLYLTLDGTGEGEAETLSGQPFDGCETCDFRERYLMAVKLAIEGYKAGEVRLE